MHRVFKEPPSAVAAPEPFAAFRAFLRSLGLVEDAVGESYRYRCRRPDGTLGWLATVHGGRRGATIYLYPDALGRGRGVAASLYRTLDEAGLGMGSKAGPSIDVDLSDEAQIALLRSCLCALLEPAAQPDG